MSHKLPPPPIDFKALGGWWVGASVIIYFRWRGLCAQNAELSAQNTESGAQNAELRCVLLGGSGRRNLIMPMALWNLFPRKWEFVSNFQYYW